MLAYLDSGDADPTPAALNVLAEVADCNFCLILMLVTTAGSACRLMEGGDRAAVIAALDAELAAALDQLAAEGEGS